MTRWQRTILWISLGFNLLFLIGGLWYHRYVSRTAKELLLMNIRAAIHVNETDLRTLESDDPTQIRRLTESLRNRVEEGQKHAAQLQQSLDKTG